MTVAWPRRTRVCATCRRALAGDEVCHAALALAEPDDRRRLGLAVWGEEGEARLAPLAERDPWVIRGLFAGGIGALALAVFVGRLFQLLYPALALFALGAFLLAPVLVHAYRAGNAWATRRSGRPDGLTPHGADDERPLLGAPAAVIGVVDGGQTATSPLGERECVAYGIELRGEEEAGSPLVLRDGATLGFTLRTNDGETVVVPPGPVDLVGPAEPAPAFRARLHLATIDGDYESSDGLDPFPFATAAEVVLVPGDVVAVHGALDPAPDPSALPTDYRRSAATVLIPRGRPRLERR